MNESITIIAIIAIIGTVILGLFVGVLYGVQSSNEKYYAALSQCVSANGIWIPTQNTGACITKESK